MLLKWSIIKKEKEKGVEKKREQMILEESETDENTKD